MSKPVAVVTGASRGAGLGIAEALGAAGWRVYLTGRTVGDGAARAVTGAGGEGIAVRVDHSDDAAVASLFARVNAENGQLNGPAYGAQKAGVDKMAADMAVDFRGTAVCTVSIWMGILLTERMRAAFDGNPDALAAFAEHAETPQFTGRLIDAVYRDADLPDLSGRTVIGAELASRYGITDEGGRRPPSHRESLGAPRAPSSVVVR